MTNKPGVSMKTFNPSIFDRDEDDEPTILEGLTGMAIFLLKCSIAFAFACWMVSLGVK